MHIDGDRGVAMALAVSSAEPMSADAASARANVIELAERLRCLGWRLATAESCTGGLIASTCTDLAGSSDWFDRGVVTYSNDSKTELLGVPHDVITSNGAVSEPVARAMAEGALARSPAQLAIAVTGVAGPGGGSVDKPVGTVWIACAGTSIDTCARRFLFDGDRAAVRQQTVVEALRLVLQSLP